jgi:hypothetical protein
MSDDIVTRLRNWHTDHDSAFPRPIDLEAADEIERLRADIEERAKLMSKIVELLVPFSMLMNKHEQELLLKAVRGE